MEQLKMTMTTWAGRKLTVNDYVDDKDIRIHISDEHNGTALATFLKREQLRDLIKFLEEIENNS